MAETDEFVLLMRRYNQRVFRVCRSVLRDDADAEDAAQDAWVQAWRHLDEVEDPDRIGAWVARIAVREALARAHRLGRTPLLDGDADVASEDTVSIDPENEAANREMGRLLERAIDELPEAFRTVLVMRLVEEMSVAETADCLDIPEDTVRTRLHRARSRVAEQLLAGAERATSRVFAFEAERCDRIVAAVLGRIG
jgi:RNA polymerase sigma-70 factor (ECF subfamily)